MNGFASRLGEFYADNLRRFAAEFFATFTFVFIGVAVTGAALNAPPGYIISGASMPDGAGYLIIALGHGVGIASGYIVVGRISGGHMNPAVTIATILSGHTGLIRGISYILGQLAGSALAVLVVDQYVWSLSDLGVQSIEMSGGAAHGLVLQVILVFFLVFVIFATTIDKRGNPVIAPLAIGMVIFVAHVIGYTLTGGSVNPARTFGPALIHGFWEDHWVYWVGPILGGVAGAVFYVILFGTKQDRDRFGTISFKTN